MVSASILTGDCRAILPTLPAGSVQCCVTSPPYWGLRDYGTAQWEGGDEGCGHKMPGDHIARMRTSGLNLATDLSKAQSNVGDRHTKIYRHTCRKCGARRIDSQIGLEPTPEAYVAELVAVFREVRRVLADDGVLWVNLADTYISAGGRHDGREDNQPGVGAARVWRDGAGRADGIVDGRGQRNRNGTACRGLAPKNLTGIPWRVAFALQADGWVLRQDIIWHKPNPMPESVTDRCTKAHEYLFMLVKQGRYYWDQGAMMEEGSMEAGTRGAGGSVDRKSHKGVNSRPPEYWTYTGTRNRRSVWTVATQPYAEAHFATFPPDLIRPCILATSRPGDTVLDPFGGSGTTGEVAVEYGRNATLIELNEDYAKLGERRTDTTPGLGI